MINLTNITVSSFDLRYLTLNWDFAQTAEPLINYTLNLYRSETPGVSGITEYSILYSGISANSYGITDYTISGLNDPTRTWFYKFKVINTITSEESVQPTTPVFRKHGAIPLIAKDILRIKTLGLVRKSGRQFYLIKKRSTGVHCTRCWDETLFRSTDGSCHVCFGTGWQNGYYNPIPFRGMINASPKYHQITMYGDWAPSDSLLYMLNYPVLRPDDVIVDDDNMRWIVTQIRYTKQLGFTIEQQAQLALIQHDDVIYNIVVGA